MNVTPKQKAVLAALAQFADEAPTARRLADFMEKPQFRSAHYTYDEVYSQLRALERKGLVERVRRTQAARANRWTRTPAGRSFA